MLSPFPILGKPYTYSDAQDSYLLFLLWAILDRNPINESSPNSTIEHSSPYVAQSNTSVSTYGI